MELGYSGFFVGQEVWIDRTDFVESVDMIRNVQTIESMMPVPITVEGKLTTTYSIYIKGSNFIYSETDLRPATEVTDVNI